MRKKNATFLPLIMTNEKRNLIFLSSFKDLEKGGGKCSKQMLEEIPLKVICLSELHAPKLVKVSMPPKERL